METSGKDATVKSEPAFLSCLACPNDSDLRDMTATNYYQGFPEVYTEMLAFCFCIQIGGEHGSGLKQQYLMCSACVGQLRAAVAFRRQLESTRDNFKAMMEINMLGVSEDIKQDPVFAENLSPLENKGNDIKVNHSDNGIRKSREILSAIDAKDVVPIAVRSGCRCNTCGRHYTQKRTLREHIIKCHPAETSQADQPRKRKRRNNSSLDVEEERSAACPTCGKIVRESTLRRHLAEHSVGRHCQCAACGKRYTRKQTLLEHIVRHHPGEQPPGDSGHGKKPGRPLAVYVRKKKPEPLPYKLKETDLECNICGESFTYHRSLQIHMPSHFPLHICERCGRGFASRRQLLVHAATHRAGRHACPVCPKLFKQRAALHTHVSTLHHGNKHIYRCKKCPDRFTNSYARKVHMAKAHGVAQRLFSCQQCTAVYKRMEHLRNHIRKIHLLERDFKCQSCSKAFFSAGDLRNHQLCHSGDRRFPCSVCGKSYLRRYTLKEHMKIHTGERSFVCAVCGKAFTQKCTLKGHMAVHEKYNDKAERDGI